MTSSKEEKDAQSSLSQSPEPHNIHHTPIMEDVKRLWYSLSLCLLVGFCGFIFGWDFGTIGGITSMESFTQQFGTKTAADGTKSFPSILVGLIIGVFSLGCAVGGIILAKIGERYGRRLGLLISMAIYDVGVIIQLAHATHWSQYFVGRIVTGMAIGTTCVLAPMLIAETSPLRFRGSMVVCFQLFVTLGILIGNIVMYSCHLHFPHSGTAWKLPVGLGLAWSTITAVGLFFTPESATFLISVGKVDEALHLTAKLNCKSVDDPEVIKAVNDIHEYEETAKSQTGNVKWHEFVTGKPRLGLRLFIAMCVMAFQQLSGVNYFFYYGTTIFQSTGMNDGYLTAIILSAVNFGAIFLGIHLAQSFGRRTVMLSGAVVMFVCMLIYACIGSFAPKGKGSGGIMILFTCIFIITWTATWGPGGWITCSEIFPTRTKAVSMALAVGVNWIVNFIITLLTPIITARIHFKYGFVFAVCLLMAIVVTYFLLPETKDKTTEEIDKMYGGSSMEGDE